MKNKAVVSIDAVNTYQEQTFKYKPGQRIDSISEAVKFVNDRKIIFFWPTVSVRFPSLWSATAGNRPVPNNHDDPGHITWRWKDELLGKGKWFYAKVLRRRSTIIALDMIENFFALSNTITESAEDVEYLYHVGKISPEEKNLFLFIFNEGPLDSITLKQKASERLTTTPGRISRSLENLQRDFRIVPTGLSTKGRWNYSYIYDTVQNSFQKEIVKSESINKETARGKILSAFFQSNGAGTIREIQKIFHWDMVQIHETLDQMERSGNIISVIIEGKSEESFSLPSLAD